MRFIHLSDLHLGKRVNEISMLEDQKFVLAQVISVIDQYKPEAVIIAGDVYDKSVPSVEAVTLFDDFLSKCSQRRIAVLIISGNHDSPERVSFGKRLMEKSGIYISPVYDGQINPVTMYDEEGPVNFYLLPYIRPKEVRRFFEDRDINSYNDAVKLAVDSMNINKAERNVIVSHQFVTGAVTSDSEEISVGGLDNIDAAIYADFDYAALGHIHGPQSIRKETIRYCGTLLKYSLSEEKQNKSITLVDMPAKGNVSVSEIPVVPYRDLRRIVGTYAQITEKAFLDKQKRDDYVYIVLTNEDEVPSARGVLQQLFPNMMEIRYDNMRSEATGYSGESAQSESKSPLELFNELYIMQNGREPDSFQISFINKLIEEIWEERE